ncbi:MAG: hypothetical protein OEW08_04685 [Gammaproteobacteria bacterium]|nr:hypothetical protein [Gammaproteobacteria bacterium]
MDIYRMMNAANVTPCFKDSEWLLGTAVLRLQTQGNPNPGCLPRQLDRTPLFMSKKGGGKE